MTTTGRPGRASSTLREHKVRILLVDDFAPIRKLMMLLLSEHQGIAEVLDAEDGPTAIHLCERFKPDLVLLDFWMPGMDGAETASHIKSLHPTVRIVAYSAVLEVQPPWADALVVKDAVPDPDRLVQLARGAA